MMRQNNSLQMTWIRCFINAESRFEEEALMPSTVWKWALELHIYSLDELDHSGSVGARVEF